MTTADTADATVRSAVLSGVTAVPVAITVSLMRRLPCVTIVGLPAVAARETAERVRSAITTSGFEFPRCRVVVTIEPADVPKHGAALDLPIALAILAASGQVNEAADKWIGSRLWAGELALDGTVRPMGRGTVPLALYARKHVLPLVVPEASAPLAASVGCTIVYGIRDLREATTISGPLFYRDPPQAAGVRLDGPHWSDIRGQDEVKAALEQAVKQIPTAPLGSYLLLIGPPGCGTTMIARRLSTLMPPLTANEVLKVFAVQSAAGLLDESEYTLVDRPFRAPHHTVSPAGLLGADRPGEVSLATHGVLFLDEAAEFKGSTLQMLKSILCAGENRQTRVTGTTVLPARPVLVVAAVNNEAEAARVKRHLGEPTWTVVVE